ncbi:MAG: hypothetical protein U0229_10810 [Anaeromyxobacter sp.]
MRSSRVLSFLIVAGALAYSCFGLQGLPHRNSPVLVSPDRHAQAYVAQLTDDHVQVMVDHDRPCAVTAPCHLRT